MVQWRYERKFVVENISQSAVAMIVRKNNAVFSEIFKPRFINNIYLDTPNLTFYLDNNTGKSNRQKVRIRWYGDLFKKVEKPVLEFKIKEGLVGTKRSFPLKSFELNKNINAETLRKIFRESDLPVSVLNEILPLEPHLLNRYSRTYFRTFDQNHRLTIDSQLEYHDIRRRHNTFLRNALNDTSIIVELKYDKENDIDTDFISSQFPFRLNKSSKYVNGIEMFKMNVTL